MEKKVIYIIITIVALISLLVAIKLSQKPTEIEFFTEEPETWIEENYITDAQDYRISVMKATNAKSTFSGNKQEYIDGADIEAFFSHGSYRGNGFNIAYLKPEFYEKNLPLTEAYKYKLMEITPILNPDDGVIQGFVMGKKEEQRFIFYIFIDEDWKSQLEFTKIIYGTDFNVQSTLNSRAYNYNEVKPGIYMDKIEYSNWYELDPVTGGIVVGDITIDDIGKNSNSTFIMLR